MKILIVDDEINIRRTTSVALEMIGHESESAASAKQAMEMLDGQHFDAALLDLRLGTTNGLDLLVEMRKQFPNVSVIVFTAHSSIETAVESMRRGAVDYVPKPFTPDDLRQTLGRVERTRKLETRVARLESQISLEAPAADFTTVEPAMQRTFDIALKAAPTSASVLILGESGTGKSVIARFMHENSAARDHAFVTVNCPCLSRELLESELFGHVKGSFTGATQDTWGKVSTADGGTLFLDEIGELPLEIQPKLLRLLQEREYERVGESRVRHADVRVIAATNRDLKQAVAEGKFREDLYYRLNVITLNVPALRNRTGDILRLAHGYLKFFADRCGKHLASISPEGEKALLQYPWPGNLRELRNCIERGIILADGDTLGLDLLPETLSSTLSNSPELGADVTLEQLEMEHIQRVLNRSKTLEDAAATLGIDPATLYRKRKKAGI